MNGAALAAAMASQVDRLATAGYRRMPSRKSEVAELLQRTGVPSPALVNDLRPFLLVGDRVPATLVEAFLRFRPREEANETLHRLAASGALVPEGDGFVASVGAIEFAHSSAEMLAEELIAMWAASASAVASASSIVHEVVAPPAGQLVIFGALADLDEPDGPPEAVFHHRLTLLRYLRSDHHALMVHKQGLTAETARVIDAMWRGEPLDAGQRRAARRLDDWVGPTGDALSAAGRERRDRIERATDDFVGVRLEQVAEAAVLPELLAELPG